MRNKKKGIVGEIIYEAHEEMAEKETENIRQKASRKFKLNDIIIKLRIGRIAVGEYLFLLGSSDHTEARDPSVRLPDQLN